MKTPYRIALSADRCLYQEAGRSYLVSPQDGHYYPGPSVDLSVQEKQVIYVDASGSEHQFLLDSVRIELNRVISDGAGRPLTRLAIGAYLPNLTEPIEYVWEPSDLARIVRAEEADNSGSFLQQ